MTTPDKPEAVPKAPSKLVTGLVVGLMVFAVADVALLAYLWGKMPK
jgi:hypothetical protein